MKNMNIPEIKTDQGIPTLYVKGEPFIAFSGEVHNSSAESLEYMETDVWPRLEGMHLNTLIVPLYWNRIEPEEGQYDVSLPEGLILQAREHEMHLIFLWFGLWKNGESSYVPDWMKQDTKTYFRAEKVNGEKMNSISPLCEAAVQKDKAAFCHIMKTIRELDEDFSTVLMMQVENEVGLLGTPCDYSVQAQAAFGGSVPEILKQTAMAESGNTWREVFGEQAEEVFMAYHYACAMEQIASAGRKEYPIPCFANVWLKQFPWYAGSYPSGGPVRDVHEIWKAAAPSLFTIAPDIYVPYVADVLDEYSYEGNPLMVPEVRKDAVAASYALYAYLHHHALCYSPFGIEDLGAEPGKEATVTEEMIAALKLDPLSFDLTGSKDALSAVYTLVDDLKPLYLTYRNTGKMKTYLQRNEADQGVYFSFADYNIEVDYFPKTKGCPAAAGVIFELQENEFLLAGMMSSFKFYPKAGENVKAGFLKMEKGTVKNGAFCPQTEMNGDELMSMLMFHEPVCYRVKVYKY